MASNQILIQQSRDDSCAWCGVYLCCCVFVICILLELLCFSRAYLLSCTTTNAIGRKYDLFIIFFLAVISYQIYHCFIHRVNHIFLVGFSLFIFIVLPLIDINIKWSIRNKIRMYRSCWVRALCRGVSSFDSGGSNFLLPISCFRSFVAM